MMEKIRRLDNRILEYIQKRIRCPFLDKVMPKITLLGNGGLIWLVVTAVFLARKTERPYGFMLSGGKYRLEAADRPDPAL